MGRGPARHGFASVSGLIEGRRAVVLRSRVVCRGLAGQRAKSHLIVSETVVVWRVIDSRVECHNGSVHSRFGSVSIAGLAHSSSGA